MQAMITTSTTVSKDISLIQNNEVFSQTSVLIICGDEEVHGLVICLIKIATYSHGQKYQHPW